VLFRSPRAIAGSWAAKASTATPSLKQAPSTLAPKPGESAKLLNPTPPLFKSSEAPVKVQSMADKSAKPKLQSQNASRDVKSPGNFGASGLSRDMAEWCSVQLKRINGSEDLTLIDFCMTLQSAGEIREYLAAYLGSNPQVSQFATEFIRRKEQLSGGIAPQISNPQVLIPKKKKK